MKVAALTVLAAGVSASKLTDLKMQTDFSDFMKKYSKEYTNEEVFERFAVFKQNMAFVNSHDAETEGYELAMNEFSDLRWEEFSAMYKGYNHRERPYATSQNLHVHSGKAPAASIDWREKNAVTPVKNQGQCGSCWAFSTTGSVESANFLSTGKLVSLSEQQLVDCSKSYGNMGCNGGLMDDAFEYIKANGITSEEDYPYKGVGGSCKKGSKSYAKVDSFRDVSKGDEKDLMDAVNVGPVSIAIEADKLGFQFYKKGVFKGNCGKTLDHGVLLVGYGTENGSDYWLIKNSWGASWGEQGYIKIVRGKDQCGLADSASYPIV